MLMPTETLSLPDRTAVRDFIASTANELAQMARQSGDRHLALALDAAASIAELRDGASTPARRA
jgi:hypothetical protein